MAVLAVANTNTGPDVDPALEAKRNKLVADATAVVVRDQETYDLAAQMVLGLVELRKEIVRHHEDIKNKARAAWKAVCDAENRLLSPVCEAEGIIKEKVGHYELEQRRRKEDAVRRAIEEQERFLAESTEAAIEAAEGAGASVEEVRAIIEQPMALPKPIIPQQHQRVAGIVSRRTYKCQVTDIRALCRAIAEGKCAMNLVLANESALNGLARSQGPEMARFVPGIRVIESVTVAGRAK